MGFVVLLVALVLLVLPAASFLYAFLAFRRLEERMRRLEVGEARRAGAPAAAPPHPTVPGIPFPPPPKPPAQPPAPVAIPAIPSPASPTPPPGPEPPPPPAPARPGTPAGRGDLEREIGTRWMIYAGAIVLVLAVGFFLKYAFENEWIGPAGRVFLGVMAGVAMLAASEAARRRAYRAFAQGLSGGGIAALYLSVYGASGFYHLIPAGAAFLLMAGITAGGMALAVLQNAAVIAVLALLGGLITPVLLSTGRDSAEALFTYLGLLDLGALGAVAIRRWRLLGLVAFAGTMLLYGAWFERFYRPERMGVALIAVMVFFVIFVAVPEALPRPRRGNAVPESILLPALAGLATLGFAWRILLADHRTGLAFLALFLSATYLVLGRRVGRRPEPDRPMVATHQVLSIAFLTLAIPIRLGLHGITLAWAAEGVVLIVLSFRLGVPLVRWGGIAALGLAVLRVFARHLPLHQELFRPVLNAPFATVLAVCVALGAGAWRLGVRRGTEGMERWASALANLGGLLLILLLTLEAAAYGRFAGEAFGRVAAFDLTIRSVLLVLWATAGLGFLLAGRATSDLPARAAGIGLLALAAGSGIGLGWGIVPGPHLEVPRLLFLNRGFLSALFVAASLAAAVRLQPESPDSSPPGAGRMGKVLGAGTVLLLLVILTDEVSRHFGPSAGAVEDIARRIWRAQMAVTVTWVLYAVALLAVGFRRRLVPLRYGAFALLGLCVLKVIVVDMAEVRQIYRIVSLLALGLVLVGVSYVYHRRSARSLRGER